MIYVICTSNICYTDVFYFDDEAMCKIFKDLGVLFTKLITNYLWCTLICPNVSIKR